MKNMEHRVKEVYFYQYCKTCKYDKLTSDDEPCNECLHNATNVNSHKPTHWKEKGKKNER